MQPFPEDAVTTGTMECSVKDIGKVDSEDVANNLHVKSEEIVMNESPKEHDFKGKKRKNEPVCYKVYHRQIEKRRRNKINDMINEIASLVPMCHSASRKMDKVSILEMAVQHMRMVTGSDDSNQKLSFYKPSIMSEEELKHLLEKSGDGFLIVLSCDRAQILYVSEEVSTVTKYKASDLVGRSLLDIVHDTDISLIKNMLTPFPSLPTICSNTSENFDENEEMHGSRRSFFARLKISRFANSKILFSSNVTQEYNSYITVLFDGYLKSWETSRSSVSGIDDDLKLSTFSCFIGVAKAVKINNHDQEGISKPPNKYTSRHDADAKYLSVDKRVYPISGYVPRDMVGNSEYKFIHPEDIKALSHTYEMALQDKNQHRFISDIYHLRLKHGGLLPMRSVAFSFFNPFSKELEFIMHQNFVMGCQVTDVAPEPQVDGNATLRQIEAAGKVHDILDESKEKSESGENDNSTAVNKTEGSQSSKCSIAPLTLNILKSNGINAEFLEKVLQKRELLSKKRENKGKKRKALLLSGENEADSTEPCCSRTSVDNNIRNDDTDCNEHQEAAETKYECSSGYGSESLLP